MKRKSTLLCGLLLLSGCTIEGTMGGDGPADDPGSGGTGEPTDPVGGQGGPPDDDGTAEGTDPFAPPELDIDPDPDEMDPEACYPGENLSYTACLPVREKDASFGSDYDYPANGKPAYQPPQRFVDLQAVDPSMMLAPHFALGELMQEHKGRWGVYQVHMVETLQAMRTASGGALNINSGYRNPTYNASVGGATYSRHMYGDAADMVSSVVSLSAMKGHCEDEGADYIGMYTSHIHCDWRYEPTDPAFFGTPTASLQGPEPTSAPPEHDATLAVDGAVWQAAATGFDEGEPYREWTAYDTDGQVIEVVAAADYTPPPAAETVEVMIGGQLALQADVDAPEAVTELPPGAVQVRLGDTFTAP